MCYESFGDLVKHWFTINGMSAFPADIPSIGSSPSSFAVPYLMCQALISSEPNVYSLLGHCFGKHAPGRSSDRSISPEGNSQTEPYIVGHNLLLSHATAVKLYRGQFKASQGGSIGLVVNMNWGGKSLRPS